MGSGCWTKNAKDEDLRLRSARSLCGEFLFCACEQEYETERLLRTYVYIR